MSNARTPSTTTAIPAVSEEAIGLVFPLCADAFDVASRSEHQDLNVDEVLDHIHALCPELESETILNMFRRCAALYESLCRQ